LLGRHAIIDGNGADAALLDDPGRLEALLKAAVEETGATVLSCHSHQFEPQGVTVAIILAESHATIHTYPEHGCYMADVFTCGSLDPTAAVEILKTSFGGDARVLQLSRGVTSND